MNMYSNISFPFSLSFSTCVYTCMYMYGAQYLNLASSWRRKQLPSFTRKIKYRQMTRRAFRIVTYVMVTYTNTCTIVRVVNNLKYTKGLHGHYKYTACMYIVGIFKYNHKVNVMQCYNFKILIITLTFNRFVLQ